MGNFSNAELLHYHRQIILPEIGVVGQQKLRDASVLVVGAGGLGCPILTYLAAAGVGTISLVDPDYVETSNLHRQPLFGYSSVNKAKVIAAGAVMRDINPHITINPIQISFNVDNAKDLLRNIDVVIDGSDNFATKYLLNDVCVELGLPLVSGSIFSFEGQVSVFNSKAYDGSLGPTYRCVYPETPKADLIPSCAESGVIGVLPSLVGSIQGMEALKLILNIGKSLSGRLLIVDALNIVFSDIKIERTERGVKESYLRDSQYYTSLNHSCKDDVKEISQSELKEKLASREDFVLIDVREIFEKEAFNIGGELIPCDEVVNNISRIPRNKEVIFYCKSGSRSRFIISKLKKDFGFDNLVSLKGGVQNWR